MRKRPLAVACGVAAICVVASLALLRGGRIGATFALFNAETGNAGSAFSAGWLDAPTALAATPQGNDVQLTWTSGTHGPPTGQTLAGVDNGTSSTCTAATLSTLATLAYTSGANSYTDAGGTSSGSGSGRGTATNGGHWFCYRVASTAGTRWSTPGTPLAVQLGLVATALSVTNASKSIDRNDTVTVTFNQKPVLPASPLNVCVVAPGTVVLGDTTATGTTACAAGDAASVGKLTASGWTIGSTVEFSSSSYTLTTAAPWKLVITLGATATTSALSGTSGSWTFVPSSSVTSSLGNGTHQAALCSTGSACQPTTTSNF
jgi:hypothetical protein